MIIVQDRIEVAAADLERLQQMFRERYQEAAAQRGLEFVESLISPPVRMQNATSTMWLRWQVADAQAWWAMRAQSGDPAVAAFWAEVDSFCISRERLYLSSATAAELSAAEDVSAYLVETRGHRETAQLLLREGVTDSGRSELVAVLEGAARQLPELEAASLAENMAPEYAAGHYTWDLLFPNQEAAEAARNSDVWEKQIEPALAHYCQVQHALAMETIGAGLRRPGLENGIKRTAYFHLMPEVTTEVAERFERDLLEMPAHIPSILNWRLSRAQALPWNNAEEAPWTYVWEQEFEDLDGLTGPYMVHPHHWAHIDRWFDPESGVQAVDVRLSHAFSSLPQSLITHEAVR